MRNIGILLAGGCGARFGGGTPKQYLMLDGKPLIAYSVEAFRATSAVDALLIVAQPAHHAALARAYGVQCVAAGESRNASLGNALAYIETHFPACENVLVHEAARPFLTAALVDAYFAALDSYDAVITAQYVTDSLGSLDAPVVDRSRYYLIQAPEAFRFKLLTAHFSAASPVTATIQQLPANCRVKRNYNFRLNCKVTYPEDLLLAEALLAGKEAACAQG